MKITNPLLFSELEKTVVEAKNSKSLKELLFLKNFQKKVLDKFIYPKSIDIHGDKEEIGKVLSVKDGVAFISGLSNVSVGEMISFVRTDIIGLVLNLQTDRVGCIIFAEDYRIKQNDLLPVKINY